MRIDIAVGWNAASAAAASTDVAWADGAWTQIVTAAERGAGAPTSFDVDVIWSSLAALSQPVPIDRSPPDSVSAMIDLDWVYLATDRHAVQIQCGTPTATEADVVAMWQSLTTSSQAAQVTSAPAATTRADLVAVWLAGTHTMRDELVRWGPGQPVQYRPPISWTADPPPPPNVPTFPNLEFYTVQNIVTLKRMPEGTLIETLGGSVSLDITSFSWRISVTLANEAGFNLLNPLGSAGPRDVQLTINGWVWNGFLTSYQTANQAGRKTWTMTGFSASQKLAAPYARARTYTSTALAAAAQLCIQELTDAGANDWSVDWQLPEWNVPAGNWTYENLTPLEAIAKVAAAAGGVIVPDPSQQVLRVVSRYPLSPSAWATATPDLVLAANAYFQTGGESVPQVAYDSVIVTGGNWGLTVVCTAQGQAGGNPMQSITENLCTELACGQERGRVELCSVGDYQKVSIATLVMDPVGVVMPGQLVNVPDDDSWNGLACSVQVAWQRSNALTVVQTIALERRQ